MKKYYSALLFLGLTAGLFSACDNEEEDQIAPEVTIEHDGTSTSCAPETVFNFKARTNTPSVSLFWTIDGKRASVDADYQYTAYELGIREIIVKASNSLGEAADTVYLNVHSSTAGKVNSLNNIVNWTGEEGSNRSVLAIQWVTGEVEDLLNPDDENIFFRAWGYRWKAGEEKTGIEMIKAIVKQDPRLYMVYNTSWDMVTGFIYDRDNDKKIHISNGTIDLTQDDFEEGIYYAESTVNFDDLQVGGEDLWLGGSENAYASYFTFDDSPSVPEQFEYAQVGVALRPLTNNSWDVYTFSPQNAEWLNTNPRPYLLEAAEAN